MSQSINHESIYHESINNNPDGAWSDSLVSHNPVSMRGLGEDIAFRLALKYCCKIKLKFMWHLNNVDVPYVKYKTGSPH
jgi:hypothetical protein